jgi:hypothetical protein
MLKMLFTGAITTISTVIVYVSNWLEADLTKEGGEIGLMIAVMDAVVAVVAVVAMGDSMTVAAPQLVPSIV